MMNLIGMTFLLRSDSCDWCFSHSKKTTHSSSTLVFLTKAAEDSPFLILLGSFVALCTFLKKASKISVKSRRTLSPAFLPSHLGLLAEQQLDHMQCLHARGRALLEVILSRVAPHIKCAWRSQLYHLVPFDLCVSSVPCCCICTSAVGNIHISDESSVLSLF